MLAQVGMLVAASVIGMAVEGTFGGVAKSKSTSKNTVAGSILNTVRSAINEMSAEADKYYAKKAVEETVADVAKQTVEEAANKAADATSKKAESTEKTESTEKEQESNGAPDSQEPLVETTIIRK